MTNMKTVLLNILAGAAVLFTAASCMKGPAHTIEPDPSQVSGPAYTGTLQVKDHVMDGACFHLDTTSGFTQGTLYLPSYEMPAMGFKMTMPAFATAVSLEKAGEGTFTISSTAFERKVEGTVYMFKKGIRGSLESLPEGKGYLLTLAYDIQPKGMPFALVHQFSGESAKN